MALSDACFEFVQDFAEAARKLAEHTHFLSSPDWLVPYGFELDALRRMAATVSANPSDPEVGAYLLKLAIAVQKYHDTLPEIPESDARRAEMNELVRVLQAELEGEDQAAVPAIVETIRSEGPYAARAAAKLKELLPKLGKSTYDLAVKVIGDVASATVKKMLGM